MRSRFLPLVPGSLVALGLALTAIPLLVDRAREDTARQAPDPISAEGTGSLPDPADPFGNHHFSRLVESAAGVLYGISRNEGLLVSYDRGRSWVSRNAGLPQKLIYPYDRPTPREITSVTVDPSRPGRIAVTTPRELQVSEDGGQSWSRIPTDRRAAADDAWPAATDHFTSAAFDPVNPDGFLLGTSFGGFYATSDRGKSWTDPSRNAEFLRRGAGMYEEVAGIAWARPDVPPDASTGATLDSSRDDSSHRPIVVGEGFGGKVYLWNPGTREARDLHFPGSDRGESIQSLWVEAWEAETAVIVTTDRSVWRYALGDGSWSLLRRAFIAQQMPAEPSEAQRARMRKAANRTGIYLGSLNASSKHIDRFLDFVVQNGMDSIVVDCKEDFGFLTYDSRLELPKAMGAIKVRFNLDELVSRAHARGVYLIGRVLVFKDRLMYYYQNGAHAVWDYKQNAPWANLLHYVDDETGETGLYQREHWTDPFDPFVADYNIAVARELEERGVDEIQFDYIRFPTDGGLATALYRHRKPGMSNVDALESFLAKAREAISIPISTDLYGFNCWNQMGTTNGQYLPVFSRYVDVICPMFYPNHFPLTFMRSMPYFDRASFIYDQGVKRAQSMVGENSLIRPYVQAFLLRTIAPEESLDVAQAGALLQRQLQAARGSASSGYTLWNASNDYYMVGGSLADLGSGM
jgi:hypothetical protein